MSTNTIIALFLALTTLAGTTTAEDCATAMRGERLIAPAIPVKSVTRVPGDLLILTTEWAGQADEVTVIQREYFPEEYRAVHTAGPKATWLGVAEGTDGHGDPALWLIAFAEPRKGTCVYGRIGDRVYERASTAPLAFSPAIRTWEESHPDKDADRR